MPRFKVAHVKEQGVDLIIVLLGGNFGSKSAPAQEAIANELQMRANSAGLAGTVVPVWKAGIQRMGFRAPMNWHPFFRKLTLRQVFQNLNKELSW